MGGAVTSSGVADVRAPLKPGGLRGLESGFNSLSSGTARNNGQIAGHCRGERSTRLQRSRPPPVSRLPSELFVNSGRSYSVDSRPNNDRYYFDENSSWTQHPQFCNWVGCHRPSITVAPSAQPDTTKHGYEARDTRSCDTSAVILVGMQHAGWLGCLASPVGCIQNVNQVHIRLWLPCLRVVSTRGRAARSGLLHQAAPSAEVSSKEAIPWKGALVGRIWFNAMLSTGFSARDSGRAVQLSCCASLGISAYATYLFAPRTPSSLRRLLAVGC